jgi:hypothetical protein
VCRPYLIQPAANEIENWRTTFKNILLNKNTIMNGVYMWSELFQSCTSCPKICRRLTWIILRPLSALSKRMSLFLQCRHNLCVFIGIFNIARFVYIRYFFFYWHVHCRVPDQEWYITKTRMSTNNMHNQQNTWRYKKKSLTNEIENWRTTFKNILLNKNTIMNGVYMWSDLFQSWT